MAKNLHSARVIVKLGQGIDSAVDGDPEVLLMGLNLAEPNPSCRVRVATTIAIPDCLHLTGNWARQQSDITGSAYLH